MQMLLEDDTTRASTFYRDQRRDEENIDPHYSKFYQWMITRYEDLQEDIRHLFFSVRWQERWKISVLDILSSSLQELCLSEAPQEFDMEHLPQQETASPIDTLAAAAKQSDEKTFVQTLERMDREGLMAEDYLQIIDLALEAGAHMQARKLSLEGIHHYPNNDELKKYTHILAPPKIIRSYKDPDLTIENNNHWLEINSNIYKNRWVALCNGELVAVENSFEQLSKEILNKDQKNILITKVY